MKKVLFMMAIAFMGAMSFSLSACSDDDSEEEPTTIEPNDPNAGKQGEKDNTKDDNGEGDEGDEGEVVETKSETNLKRAITMMDAAVEHYFEGDEMKMYRFYNALMDRHFAADKGGNEIGSVWMYTSSIEAVNSILAALKDVQSTNQELYNKNFDRYVELLNKLYDGLDYYAGTYTLTSYTQKKEWTVYGVNRSNSKGGANVVGKENVYDDNEWLVCEMVRAYNITGDAKFLKKAEYLASYILDGWDCVLDSDGNEYGGICWGPGYVGKMACSNAPMVAPLVRLHNIYKGKADKITYRIIEKGTRNRIEDTKTKEEYYLNFAKKIYDWQHEHLLRKEDGVYADQVEVYGDEKNLLENVNGVEYRKGLPLKGAVGNAWTYNSGTMVSGAAELYKVTNDDVYKEHLEKLIEDTRKYFSRTKFGMDDYISYAEHKPGENEFRQWFADVLMTGYVEAYSVVNIASLSINSFQKTLDYAWERFRQHNTLPYDLISGWLESDGDYKYRVEAMVTFAYISEYAQLASYEVNKVVE